MTKIAAEKARNSLATGLYDKMFGQMMHIINNHLSSSSVNYSIGILDIAGFGKMTMFFLLRIYYYYLQINTEIKYCFFRIFNRESKHV